MIEAIKLWNEPNNLSHWDFTIDPQWETFSKMVISAANAIRSESKDLTIVLGGISPIDPNFIKLMKSYGVLNVLDAVAVHGFPLDWNHWKIHEWPTKISTIQAECELPIWITEVGASSFGADEVQVFGLQKTIEILINKVPRIHWYSLLDLPPTWEATTRHKESEGSAYYRHFYMGLIDKDNNPKPAYYHFNPELGICQWFHFEDFRLEIAISWLKKLGVKKLRTGISWADWHREGALKWFDHQMKLLDEFDTTITLCFTPPSLGINPNITSPPHSYEEFADFSRDIVKRYVLSGI